MDKSLRCSYVALIIGAGYRQPAPMGLLEGDC
jgi:hypothetical protein